MPEPPNTNNSTYNRCAMIYVINITSGTLTMSETRDAKMYVMAACKS